MLRRLSTAGLVAGALAFASAGGRAAIAVLPESGAGSALQRIELAGAISGPETVLWCAVQARRSLRFAVIAEITPETSVETGLDAWLQALDYTSAPRILAPELEPPAWCGVADRDPVLHYLQRSRGARAVSTVVVDRPGLPGTLAAWELPALEPPLLGLRDANAPLFAALFELGDGGGTSQTLRIRFGASLPSLPFACTPGAPEIPITSYLIGSGLIAPRALTLLEQNTPFVTYRVASRGTDYADAARTLLGPHAGAAWLLESSIGTLTEWGFYADGVAVPPLFDEYFRGAQMAGEIETEPAECAFDAALWLSGQTPAQNPACGRADDLDLALSGMPLEGARVTRYLALSDGSYDPALAAVAVETLARGAIPPVVTADASEEPGCAQSPSPTPVPPIGPAPADPVPSPAPDPVDVPDLDEDSYYYESSDAECGASSSEASGDSCASDSSSESEDCEGDGSSGDDSYGGDSCASDDTSDDYDGESCGSDEPSSDDSYSGDTCDGDSGQALRPKGSSAGPLPRASIARSRKTRPRLSVLTLALFAAAFSLRRVRRHRGRARAL